MHLEGRFELRMVPLTERNLEEAPDWDAPPWSCRYCLYWEHPELAGRVGNEEAFGLKKAWVRRTGEAFGDCGRILHAGGRAAGYAQYAPPGFLPNAQTYPAGPASNDAVLLACLFLPSPADRGRGWGSLVLQDILGELCRRGVAAVETFARRGSAENPSGPLGFYLRHGFTVRRDDPEFPLLRFDLSARARR